VRILIVDDSASVRTRLAALLASEVPGAVVHEARDGIGARELVRAMSIDAVVLDLHMPREDGLGILAAIKAMANAPRVVILTGDPTEQHRRACLANGADAFLDKSTEFDRVAALVRATVAKDGV
jgi:DNA-binding NarL/FixJ family response regulator